MHKGLELDEKNLPESLLSVAKKQEVSLLAKFEEDMFSPEHGGLTSNTLSDKIARISVF